KEWKWYCKSLFRFQIPIQVVNFFLFYRGVNVVPFLELIGLPDSIVNILKNSQSGNALTAYALYKIATPARYTVTLGGTSITVKYLRKNGYMSTPPPVKEYLQDRMEETKDKITEKMEETKDKITEKMEETKDKITEKIQETKDKVSFK
ncbi:F210A protein, partial [Thalassarche chlororhynchos]|nr:F210A protein [Thalassarche chlororhynchos]